MTCWECHRDIVDCVCPDPEWAMTTPWVPEAALPVEPPKYSRAWNQERLDVNGDEDV